MNIITVQNAFTVEECQNIIISRMHEDLNPAYSPGMRVDPEIRSSMVNFMYEEEEENQWIYDRLWELTRQHPLSDSIEKLPFVQFAEYDSYYSGHFKPHRDTENFYHATNKKHFTRKLTIVTQLSDPSAYIGGDIKLYDMSGETIIGQKDRGCAIIFPSNTLHEVSKVTAGIRYSMAAWFEGRK